MFTTTYCISGIASIDEENVVILGVNKGDTLDTMGVKPQLLVLETHPNEYFEISSDMLSPRGFTAYQCHDYHLGAFDDGYYFIVCPKDMIIAKLREEDDHVSWLVEHKRYAEALVAIRASRALRKFSSISVGKEYLEYLFEKDSEESYDKVI